MKTTSNKKSLAELKSVYAPATNTNTNGTSYTNNYYPFWNIKSGERAVIRFLPDANENNPRGFLAERVSHSLEINGQRRTIPCLTMYNEECPICKISQAYYKVKDEINGKKYWKSRQYIAQAIIVEDPLPPNEETGEKHTGQVRYVTLGYQIHNIIKDAFGSDELEYVPYDFENGYDFIIKKSEQGNYSSYAVGTKFANKPRALTEEELSNAYDNMVDLSTLLPKHPGTEKVQAMLDAEMNGVEYVDEGSTNSKPAIPQTEDAPVVAKTTSKTTKPVVEPDVDEDDDDSNPDVDDMLAKIRQRRAAANN